MWFFALLGLVVVGIVIAAVLDRRAKKIRGSLNASTADPYGHVSKVDPQYLNNTNPTAPHMEP